MIDQFTTLLLDMNSTFMFNEDRFGPAEDYHATYKQLGGSLGPSEVHALITACYAYLDVRYPDPVWHDQFPTVKEVLAVLPQAVTLDLEERDFIAETFALHELGQIPKRYADMLHQLAATHRLALVADIWSQKRLWVEALKRAGVSSLFDALIFSSDIRSVKPSPKPFLAAIDELGVSRQECVVIGDSARRDIGSAEAAGIAAIWIGEGKAPAYAMGRVGDLGMLIEDC